MVHYLPARCGSWFHRLLFFLCLSLLLAGGSEGSVNPFWSSGAFSSWSGGGQSARWRCSKVWVPPRIIHLMHLNSHEVLCLVYGFCFLNMLNVLFLLPTNPVFLDLFILVPKSLSYHSGDQSSVKCMQTSRIVSSQVHCLLFAYPESHLHFITPSLGKMKVCCFLHG